MWDAWAVFVDGPQPWLHENEVIAASDVEAARSEAISYATYQLLRHRFRGSPGWKEMEPAYRGLMLELGLDPDDDATRGDAPSAVGNRIAIEYIFFGLTDGANEVDDYANQWYLPVNEPLVPPEPGTQGILEPNRWQPLALEYFVDQSGNIEIGGYPEFLGPEWGQVSPFSLPPRNESTTSEMATRIPCSSIQEFHPWWVPMTRSDFSKASNRFFIGPLILIRQTV